MSKMEIPRKLNGPESLFCKLSVPERNQVLHGLLQLDGVLTEDELLPRVQKMVDRHPRLKQRIVYRDFPLASEFVANPAFVLAQHVRSKTLLSMDEESLKAAAAEIMSQELPFATEKMPWEIWLLSPVSSLSSGPKSSALFLRVHHAITDGVRANLLLMSLLTTANGEPLKELSIHHSTRHNPPTSGSIVVFLLQFITNLFSLLLYPFYSLKNIFLTHYEHLTSDTTMRWTLRHDRQAPMSSAKCINWSRPLPLDTFKRLKQSFHVTVNDTLLSLIAGAIRRCCERDGVPCPYESVYVSVPINIKRSFAMDEPLGNHLGGVSTRFSLSAIADTRLMSISKRMHQVKQYPLIVWYNFLFIHLFGRTPAWLSRAVFGEASTKASTLITNVPGPQEPLLCGNTKVMSLIAFGPETYADGGIAITITSYDGAVRVAVNTDVEPYTSRHENGAPVEVVPLPTRLIEAVHAEYELWMELTEQHQHENKKQA
eukprot:GILK01004466.1.p1 GENE.GILK01004466.1~~GILK01004466.1.p1  ORF type:complete len:485 (+),score=48.36 GILK01004466.1:46-1500(+)